MLNEKEFYNILSEVPEPPTEMFVTIDKRIKERRFVRRVVYSLAASLIIILTGISFFYYNEKKIEKEVFNELKNINEYLNGNDIESDLDLYAVVDGY